MAGGTKVSGERGAPGISSGNLVRRGGRTILPVIVGSLLVSGIVTVGGYSDGV